jgi:hypothetical protein
VSGVIFFADPHTGLAAHDVPLAGGTSLRRVEAERIYDFLGAEALSRGATLVCLGDIYNAHRPPAWAYEATKRLPASTIAFRGNHDGYEVPGMVEPLTAASEWLRVIDKPSWHSVNGITLLVVPWFGRSFAASAGGDVQEQFARMNDALAALVADLSAHVNRNQPIVLCCHTSIGGATYSSDVQPMLGESSEFFASLPAITRPEFECVMAGHIHKPQEVHGGSCPVHYVGSAVRTDFGEEGQTCRAVHMTPDGRMEDIYLPAIEFLTLDVDAHPDLTEALPLVAGKVVRFRGELPAGPESAAMMRALSAAAELAGALRVSAPAIKFTRHDAIGEHTIRVEQTPSEALADYITLVGGQFEEERAELMSTHAELAGAASATV